MGAVFLHGMGTSSGARQCGVTHVPGLKCYLCPRTVPSNRLTSRLSGRAWRAAQRRSVSWIVLILAREEESYNRRMEGFGA